ncbi:MAG: histidine phosphatase family protein [Chromatiales bacterium]|jgi:broad specificity phosphatase PhoE|nr:histidine phosphatase family protein [Chromatiales bacterium]
MAILVIRHGETDLNAGRVIQWPDTPLSKRGVRQAARLGERLANASIGRIIASDYARAYSTAEAVAAANGAPLEVVTSLRERHFGDLRGKSYTDLTADPHAQDYEPPGGESWPVFHERVDKAWADILEAQANTEGDLAVVTHGLVLRSLVDRLVAPPEGVDVGAVVFRNTSLTRLEGPPWAAVLVGCAEHLDGDLLADGAAA